MYTMVCTTVSIIMYTALRYVAPTDHVHYNVYCSVHYNVHCTKAYRLVDRPRLTQSAICPSITSLSSVLEIVEDPSDEQRPDSETLSSISSSSPAFTTAALEVPVFEKLCPSRAAYKDAFSLSFFFDVRSPKLSLSSSAVTRAACTLYYSGVQCTVVVYKLFCSYLGGLALRLGIEWLTCIVWSRPAYSLE